MSMTYKTLCIIDHKGYRHFINRTEHELIQISEATRNLAEMRIFDSMTINMDDNRGNNLGDTVTKEK